MDFWSFQNFELSTLLIVDCSEAAQQHTEYLYKAPTPQPSRGLSQVPPWAERLMQERVALRDGRCG